MPLQEVVSADATEGGATMRVAAEYVHPELVTYTGFRVNGTSQRLLRSIVYRFEPQEGELTIDGFLTMPEPADEVHAFHAPIHFTAPTTDRTSLYVLHNQAIVWTAIGPGDSASLTLPALPTGAESDPMLGPGAYEADIRTCVLQPGRTRCERLSTSTLFRLVGAP